jgi:predicted glycoside hydrolase/deacetylase ChbG (UPF0249 family)
MAKDTSDMAQNPYTIADDFGLHHEANVAIIAAWNSGHIQGTSLLVSGEAVQEAKKLWQSNRALPLGLHFNLVEGTCVSDPADVASLVKPDGTYYSLPWLLLRLFLGKVQKKDIETELENQLKLLKYLSPICDHINTHQNTHMFGLVGEVVLAKAKEFGIHKVRGPVSVEKRLRRFPVKFLAYKLFRFLLPIRITVPKEITLTTEDIIHPGTHYD